jgi:arsenate reductase
LGCQPPLSLYLAKLYTRFIGRFGLAGLIDTEGKAYIEAGLKYLKRPDAELLVKIERDPKLLRLPLARDEESWKAMLAQSG